MREKTRLFYESELTKLQPIIDFVCDFMDVHESDFYNYKGKGKTNISFCKQMISFLADKQGITHINIGRKLYPNNSQAHACIIYNVKQIKIRKEINDIQKPTILKIERNFKKMLNNI